MRSIVAKRTNWLNGISLAALGILTQFAISTATLATDDPVSRSTSSKDRYMEKITGEFDVKIIPVETGEPHLGMMLLDKVYRGSLQGTGKGRMLTGMTSVKVSAGYVAIERIEGELMGRRGSFIIQHSGTMSKGKQSLMIRVISDSGTDGLVGLEGEMQIRIVDRVHFYDFEYSLPEAFETSHASRKEE